MLNHRMKMKHYHMMLCFTSLLIFFLGNTSSKNITNEAAIFFSFAAKVATVFLFFMGSAFSFFSEQLEVCGVETIEI